MKLDQNLDVDVDNEELAFPVRTIYICVLCNEFIEGDEAGEAPTNHWIICLEPTPTLFVMPDMALGYGEDGRQGKICVTAGKGRFTHEILHAFTFHLLPEEWTIMTFLVFIPACGRQEFNFSPEW